MGEYAALKSTGAETKIGTCEDMLYLRFDQLDQIRAIPHSLDPRDRQTQETIRFRFPWPDEDGILPGAFDGPDRKLSVHIPPPDGVEHGTVQFSAREGYMVSLPCPEGPEAEHGLRIARNGFPGPTALVQQAVRDGRLVAVMQCVCGRRYRLPTLEDAQPVIDELIERSQPGFRQIAARLQAGYEEVL